MPTTQHLSAECDKKQYILLVTSFVQQNINVFGISVTSVHLVSLSDKAAKSFYSK